MANPRDVGLSGVLLFQPDLLHPEAYKHTILLHPHHFEHYGLAVHLFELVGELVKRIGNVALGKAQRTSTVDIVAAHMFTFK